ncbi:MAG: hypothetical protein CM15mP79_0640 [Methanobacteriota archaeon]|nr:MAG: hypothetical protein CM15mP79_0640 [Euryarchaeota archaeon]
MENEDGTRFGPQFHPEVNDSEYGREIFPRTSSASAKQPATKPDHVFRFA